MSKFSKRKVSSPFEKSTYTRNAKVYKLLANPTRLEILNTIKYQEASVDELAEVLGLRKANVSQHLALLRHAKIVTVRGEGLNRFYRVSDPRIIEPCRILREMHRHKK